MPVIKSDYKAPFYLFSRHLQTILPALFRKVGNVVYDRQRILTPDNDFLDLDWSRVSSDVLVILSHGLEGNTQTGYIKGMVKALNNHGWDALAWNYRGCSGEINQQHRFYHSGETGDLHYVIEHCIAMNKYSRIFMIGFSIGGNITLKYLGEQSDKISPIIKKAVVFSVPTDLAAGAKHLAKFQSKVYMNRFLASLHLKLKAKAEVMPDKISLKEFDGIKNFYEFDERYTAPIHGFKNAEEYWKENSSKQFIKRIRIPTLIVNAKNDPFLTPECFPIKEVDNHPLVFLEMPETGGHVGFYRKCADGTYWSEHRAIEFLKNGI